FRLAEKPSDIVRPYRAFQSMEKEEPWRTRRSVETMDVDEIPIWCVPSLETQWQWRSRAKKLSPQRLPMRARYPPSGAVDFGSMFRRHGHGPRWHGGSRSITNRSQRTEFQSSGAKKTRTPESGRAFLP